MARNWQPFGVAKSYELRAKNYELRYSSFELRATGYGVAMAWQWRFRDWFHRCWRDLSHAMARPGLLPEWYATAYLYNVGHGPWQIAKFWRDICGSLEDLAKMLTPDSVILQWYWPRVLVDKSLHHDVLDEQVGRAGRERFIQNLAARSQEITDLRGHKVKPAQWVSWNKAHDEWDSEMSTRAMLLGQLALDRGWIPRQRICFRARRALRRLARLKRGSHYQKARRPRSARPGPRQTPS